MDKKAIIYDEGSGEKRAIETLYLSEEELREMESRLSEIDLDDVTDETSLIDAINKHLGKGTGDGD